MTTTTTTGTVLQFLRTLRFDNEVNSDALASLRFELTRGWTAGRPGTGDAYSDVIRVEQMVAARKVLLDLRDPDADDITYTIGRELEIVATSARYSESNLIARGVEDASASAWQYLSRQWIETQENARRKTVRTDGGR